MCSGEASGDDRSVPVTIPYEAVAPAGSYALIALLVGGESAGLPLPGELAMVSAAVFAATTGDLSLGGVVLAASSGAVLGGILGYALGRRFGGSLLHRFGPRIGLTPRRLLLGRYLFARHGGKIVGASRFIVVARHMASLMAGANGMAFGPFLLWNLAGGVAWPGLYCSLAFAFGTHAAQFSQASLVVMGLLFVAGLGWLLRTLRRHEARLTELAELAEAQG